MALAEQSGGRFVLGLGVSHDEMVRGVLGAGPSSPLGEMGRYLDRLDQLAATVEGYPAVPPTVLAALGPRMLSLAAERTQGAFPVLVSPAHTRRAREVMGPGPLLAVKQYVVVDTDADRARRAARHQLSRSLSFVNYRRSLTALGFEEADLEHGGSDRLVDEIVPWGDETGVAERLAAHHTAGADHVCVAPIAVDDPGATDLDALDRLAPV